MEGTGECQLQAATNTPKRLTAGPPTRSHDDPHNAAHTHALNPTHLVRVRGLFAQPPLHTQVPQNVPRRAVRRELRPQPGRLLRVFVGERSEGRGRGGVRVPHSPRGAGRRQVGHRKAGQGVRNEQVFRPQLGHNLERGRAGLHPRP